MSRGIAMAVQALLLAMLTVLLAACGGAATVRPADPGHRPLDEAGDEAGLWQQMARFEADVAASPSRVQDRALEAYLQDLSCRVTPDYCGDIRVYLLRAPYFNASMAPNGMMLVWTGLLLRVEDEAQLAFVLGHEVAHFRHRDSLRRWRRIKDTEGVLAGLSLLGGALGASIVGVAGAVSGYAALFAYGRDQERAADAWGLVQMQQAGYEPMAAVALWQALLAEDAVRERDLLSGIFATHPATAERIERLTQMVQGLPEGAGRLERERYQARIADWRTRWLSDELDRRHYAQSLVLLQRLAGQAEWAGPAHFALGELHRLRQQPGDLERALQHYDRAASSPDWPAQGYRQRGQVHQRLGLRDAARADFRAYLEAVPEAPDGALVRQLLEQLGRPEQER